VDPVPDPLLLRKSGSAQNLTRTLGSVARNSDHYTTEALIKSILVKFKGDMIFEGLLLFVSHAEYLLGS
jgi:hypothetical protein